VKKMGKVSKKRKHSTDTAKVKRTLDRKKQKLQDFTDIEFKVFLKEETTVVDGRHLSDNVFFSSFSDCTVPTQCKRFHLFLHISFCLSHLSALLKLFNRFWLVHLWAPMTFWSLTPMGRGDLGAHCSQTVSPMLPSGE